MSKEKSKSGLHILVAVKGVTFSENTARLTASIIDATGGKMTLLRVILDEQRLAQAQVDLERFAELITPNPVRTLVRIGQASVEISAEAASGEYDLVVIGERPENTLLKRLFARTAEKVIRSAACPVLIARQRTNALKRLLICEGGQSTRLLPALTGKLAPLMLAAEKIVILHVMSQMTALPGIRGWELRADADELIDQHTPEGIRLEYDQEVLKQLNVPVEVKVRHGLVVDEIISEAEAQDFDVIVMGMPAVTGLQRYLVDDPVHKILLHGTRPVLVVQ
jgi:nucleotide-binding universal stress UspA family protein